MRTIGIEEVYDDNQEVNAEDEDLIREFELFDSCLDDYLDMEKAE